MKNILFILVFFTILSCSKDNASSGFALPPETQTGANTFGVTINNKVYIPRDPTGFTYGPSGHGMIFWASPDSLEWDELEVIDGASAVGFQIFIHIQNLKTIGSGNYPLYTSNFHSNIDGVPLNSIFFKIWDNNISNYAYYGSVENEGEINITRNDTLNYITSGNFSGKFVRYDNPNDFIQITNGRFDIGPGLYDRVFP